METFFWGYHFEEFSSIGPISVSYNREPCGSLASLLDYWLRYWERLRCWTTGFALKVSFFPMVCYSVTWFIWVYLIEALV